jgi:hypothetical protein
VAGQGELKRAIPATMSATAHPRKTARIPQGPAVFIFTRRKIRAMNDVSRVQQERGGRCVQVLSCGRPEAPGNRQGWRRETQTQAPNARKRPGVPAGDLPQPGNRRIMGERETPAPGHQQGSGSGGDPREFLVKEGEAAAPDVSSTEE